MREIDFFVHRNEVSHQLAKNTIAAIIMRAAVQISSIISGHGEEHMVF